MKRKLLLYLKNVYFSVIPFGTILSWLKARHARKVCYSGLLMLSEVNDELLALMKRHRFSYSDANRDLRVAVHRAKFCPEEMLPEFIEIEIEGYFTEQLHDLLMANYVETGVPTEVYAKYIPDNDKVLVTVGYHEDFDAIRMLMPINILITVLFIITIILTILSVWTFTS